MSAALDIGQHIGAERLVGDRPRDRPHEQGRLRFHAVEQELQQRRRLRRAFGGDLPNGWTARSSGGASMVCRSRW
jgi:hypothetical protein